MNYKSLATLALGMILAVNTQAKSLLFSMAMDDGIVRAPAPSRDLYANLNVFRTGAGVLKIQFSAVGLPEGISISFSHNPMVFTANDPGTLVSTLNVAVAPTVPSGVYTCEIRALELVHGDTDSVTFTFTVGTGGIIPWPPQLAIKLVPFQGEVVPEVSWLAQPGQAFMLQATPSLSEPIVWTNLGFVTADAHGNCRYNEIDMEIYPMRFYRVLAQEY